jgi:hypothetical protein
VTGKCGAIMVLQSEAISTLPTLARDCGKLQQQSDHWRWDRMTWKTWGFVFTRKMRGNYASSIGRIGD